MLDKLLDDLVGGCEQRIDQLIVPQHLWDDASADIRARRF
jgi:hypothetical protein